VTYWLLSVRRSAFPGEQNLRVRFEKLFPDGLRVSFISSVGLSLNEKNFGT